MKQHSVPQAVVEHHEIIDDIDGSSLVMTLYYSVTCERNLHNVVLESHVTHSESSLHIVLFVKEILYYSNM